MALPFSTRFVQRSLMVLVYSRGEHAATVWKYWRMRAKSKSCIETVKIIPDGCTSVASQEVASPKPQECDIHQAEGMSWLRTVL